MSQRNFDADYAITRALVPPPPTTAYYHTGRSGLEVKIEPLGLGDWPEGCAFKGDTRRNCVKVSLDGYVDAADAEHLENFFRKLKDALPPI